MIDKIRSTAPASADSTWPECRWKIAGVGGGYREFRLARRSSIARKMV